MRTEIRQILKAYPDFLEALRTADCPGCACDIVGQDHGWAPEVMHAFDRYRTDVFLLGEDHA